MEMKYLHAIMLLSLCAAPVFSQQASSAPAAGQASDSVQEMANALMRAGSISQPDWWKIMNLRGAELKAPAVGPANSMPPAVTPPAASPAQPPAAQVSAPFPLLGKGVTMKIGALAQFRYTWAQAAANATNTSAFALKTARLKFSGDLPDKFKYAIQLAFERTGSTYTANSALYDFMVIYAPRPEVNYTFGQFTVPFGAETTAPTDQLDFAARYYAQDRLLNPSCNHDTGVMVSGKLLKERLLYYAGAFNGKGPNYTDNDNEKFLYSGRLVWTAFKGRLLGRDSSLVLGGSAMGESTRNDASAMRASDIGTVVFTRAYRRYVYGGDLVFRAGPAALKGEYIAALLDGQGSDPEIRGYGWHGTLAYRLPGEKVELLARWQGYDPNTAHRTGKDIKWTTLGVNWFINGNNARVLANYTFKNEAAKAVRNDEFVTQLQVSF